MSETAAESLAPEIGRRLTARRKQLRMSQQDVADAISAATPKNTLTRAAYAQWEGAHTKPDVDRIKLAARVLEMSPAYLAFGEASASEGDGHDSVTISELTDTSKDSMERWTIPRSAIARSGVADHALKMFRAKYGLAEQGIREGAFLLVDTGAAAVTQPGIYVWLNDGRLELAGMALRPSSSGSLVVVKAGPVTFEIESADLDVRGRVLACWMDL